MTNRRVVLLEFLGLWAFWVVLSARWDPLFVVTGLVSAAGVTVLTAPLVSAAIRGEKGPVPLRSLPLVTVRFVAFLGWMAGRMLLSSIQIAVTAVSPRLALDPCEIRFTTMLRSPLARTLLTNSISLVPGTLTIDIDGDEIWVHALTPTQVGDLTSGRLQNKIAGLFLDGPQPLVDPDDIHREVPR